jgi:hypothetical protein
VSRSAESAEAVVIGIRFFSQTARVICERLKSTLSGPLAWPPWNQNLPQRPFPDWGLCNLGLSGDYLWYHDFCTNVV